MTRKILPITVLIIATLAMIIYGCKKEDDEETPIDPEPPTASFISNITSGTVPLTVSFTDQSTNNPTSWQWDFGDGGASTQPNPTHTFNSEGSYTVTLTVSNNYGSDTETKSNYIIVSGGDPNTFTDPRDGQTYNIVEIGNQTWFAENLNYETGNSWCYDNDPSNCATYGRLYDWQTAIGVCPTGWHLPSDDEWKILEGNADTRYGVGDPEWDHIGYRGYDAGKRLKSQTGWYQNNGADAFGFSGLAGGYRSSQWPFPHFRFDDVGSHGHWWSATEDSSADAWSRSLGYDDDEAHRRNYNKERGFSVRCVRD